MPHPEAYTHYTNHPDWTRKREELARMGKKVEEEEGEGVAIFRNAVTYIREHRDV
jgi:phosphoribosylformylglycinamidine synthase subunit PurQ / glutaminase